MNNNLLFLLPLILSLIALGTVLINDKKTLLKNKKLLIPFIVIILVSAVGIDVYFEKYYRIKKEEISTISYSYKRIRDSLALEVDSNLNDIKIDDLKSLKNKITLFEETLESENKRLKKYKNELEQIESIIGKKDETKNEIIRQLDINTHDINLINRFNKRIDLELLKKYNNKGSMVSGQSSRIFFSCPSDNTSDSISLTLKFVDEVKIEDVAYLSIQFSEVVGEKEWRGLSTDLFEPQNGINTFKVKNHFKNNSDKKVNLEVGFFMKSDMDKEYPRYERRICKNY